MASSDYGLNFGFRRSGEGMWTAREGGYKTPVSGSALKLGTAVEIDPASEGYLKASATGTTPKAGYQGLLIQEDAHIFTIYERQWKDTADLGLAKKDCRSIIGAGTGLKVWFRNTPQVTSPDGTVTAAVTMGTFTGLVVGDLLTWNGTSWVETSSANPWMKVTKVDSDFAGCEAVLLF